MLEPIFPVRIAGKRFKDAGAQQNSVQANVPISIATRMVNLLFLAITAENHLSELTAISESVIFAQDNAFGNGNQNTL